MIKRVAVAMLRTGADVNPLGLFFHSVDVGPTDTVAVSGTHRGAGVEILVMSNHSADVR